MWNGFGRCKAMLQWSWNSLSKREHFFHLFPVVKLSKNDRGRHCKLQNIKKNKFQNSLERHQNILCRPQNILKSKNGFGMFWMFFLLHFACTLESNHQRSQGEQGEFSHGHSKVQVLRGPQRMEHLIAWERRENNGQSHTSKFWWGSFGLESIGVRRDVLF